MSASAVGSLRRIGAALAGGAREYRRTPVLLALLAGLPAYAIFVFTAVMPDATVRVAVEGRTVTAGLPTVTAAFLTPMVAGLLTGIAGLFLVGGADTDGRLVVAGYRSVEIVLARLGLLAAVGALASVVSVAVASTVFTPESTVAYGLSVWLAALVYGAVGLLVGTTLARLPGVYLVLFGSMVDLFLFQNPLAADPPGFATYLPGHFPMDLAMAAGFDGSVDPAAVGWSLVALGLLTVAGTVGFYRRMRPA